METDTAYTQFSEIIQNILNTYAPEKTIKIPEKFLFRDPWMTTELLTSSRTLNKLYKKTLGKSKEHPNCIQYTQFRNSYNRTKKNTKEQYFNDILGQYKQDIRKTWGVVNALIGRTNDKTSISEKFKIKNKITNDANYISNEFCIFFYKHWSRIC